MASSSVKGISLQERTWRRLDQLAKREGTNRSQMIGRLVERESSAVPDVRVDGRRFVPEKS